jgi:2-oxoglutarate ferredoxin oxidoreductase subunit beta
LHVTQKNDNPVTQGTGFSVSEVILDPEPILYTGIERPDAVLVVSEDGARELTVTGALARADAETLVVADDGIELPPLPGTPLRLPLRNAAGPKLAALAAVAAWREATGALPEEALRTAAVARIGDEGWTALTRRDTA